ncbi:MAG: hypothetical protein PHY31_09505, partial [Smithellaceae bacterium]|nr:hypothetical protein [Smithellaceae bacterium]
MTVRTRLLIVTILGLALTMGIWGWIQLKALDKILVDQQLKRIHAVADTVGTYYHYFPRGRGLSALDAALADNLQSDVRLARIDILSVAADEDVDIIASVSRVHTEW